MSDSLPQPEPDNADTSSNVSASDVPSDATQVTSDATQALPDVIIDAITGEEIIMPQDPAALDADRAGFKFLAISFAIFFALIAICASIVAVVMKNMGI